MGGSPLWIQKKMLRGTNLLPELGIETKPYCLTLYRSTLSQAAQSVWLQKHSVASCAVGVVTEALCRKLRSWCGYH